MKFLSVYLPIFLIFITGISCSLTLTCYAHTAQGAYTFEQNTMDLLTKSWDMWKCGQARLTAASEYDGHSAYGRCIKNINLPQNLSPTCEDAPAHIFNSISSFKDYIEALSADLCTALNKETSHQRKAFEFVSIKGGNFDGYASTPRPTSSRAEKYKKTYTQRSRYSSSSSSSSSSSGSTFWAVIGGLLILAYLIYKIAKCVRSVQELQELGDLEAQQQQQKSPIIYSTDPSSNNSSYQSSPFPNQSISSYNSPAMPQSTAYSSPMMQNQSAYPPPASPYSGQFVNSTGSPLYSPQPSYPPPQSFDPSRKA